MISGFGNSSSTNVYHHFHARHSISLPVPFNIPKVLHNFLFEDVELQLDAKQKDLLEALRFSYLSLIEFHKELEIKQSQLKAKILAEPDNIETKNEYKDTQLDQQEANYDFKNLLEINLDMLQRKQIEELLRFSEILV